MNEKSFVYLGNPNLKKANVPVEFTQEQIIEFEKFYIFFGQLIAEWRIKYQSAPKDISFDFKKAKRDVVDLLDKL